MLEVNNVNFTIQKDGEDLHLLEKVTVKVPRGHFMAIVGPSGCGKSTLLKTIAGINVESEGELKWDGRNLSEEGDLEPHEFGYVPQFSIAYDQMTVEESIDNAVRLRLKTEGRADLESRSDKIIQQTGLDAIRERRVSVLSGGQKRRLGLALELATNPDLLLCDEVTSGLDPKSEAEIVKLLHKLAKTDNRVVISVTHSLGNLDLYDSVLVLYEGRVVYHGPPRAINHYFGVSEAEDVYPQLAKRESGDWGDSWTKYRDEYYRTMEIPENSPPRQEEDTRRAPGFLKQVSVLLERRWKIFFRDKTQLILQLAMLLIFPGVVVLFALDGLPNLEQGADTSGTLAFNPDAAANAVKETMLRRTNYGGVVSGLIMFQVVLLALMGSNNSAREIAGERQIYEKEKLGGLGVVSYLTSKFMFLIVFVLIQSLWMYIFVWCFTQNMPTNGMMHPLLLVLVNASMTAVCLGISASMKNADQASLLSIYLVGFQLPLSGAILALPDQIEPILQPLISAYWGWSGIVESISDNVQKQPVHDVTDATLRPTALCAFLLLGHILVGGLISLIGAAKGRWAH